MPDAAGARLFHRMFVHMDMLGIAIVACLVVGLASGEARPRSFNELRTNLTGVREGRDAPARRRLSGRSAAAGQRSERLLDDREQRVTRALTKAGDLAHGLKTPLTLLNQQAERAKAEGQTALAAAIMQQVDRMRRQVDYHLAHARASASGGNPTARCHVLTSADGWRGR